MKLVILVSLSALCLKLINGGPIKSSEEDFEEIHNNVKEHLVTLLEPLHREAAATATALKSHLETFSQVDTLPLGNLNYDACVEFGASVGNATVVAWNITYSTQKIGTQLWKGLQSWKTKCAKKPFVEIISCYITSVEEIQKQITATRNMVNYYRSIIPNMIKNMEHLLFTCIGYKKEIIPTGPTSQKPITTESTSKEPVITTVTPEEPITTGSTPQEPITTGSTPQEPITTTTGSTPQEPITTASTPQELITIGSTQQEPITTSTGSTPQEPITTGPTPQEPSTTVLTTPPRPMTLEPTSQQPITNPPGSTPQEPPTTLSTISQRPITPEPISTSTKSTTQEPPTTVSTISQRPITPEPISTSTKSTPQEPPTTQGPTTTRPTPFNEIKTTTKKPWWNFW